MSKAAFVALNTNRVCLKVIFCVYDVSVGNELRRVKERVKCLMVFEQSFVVVLHCVFWTAHKPFVCFTSASHHMISCMHHLQELHLVNQK